MRDNRGCTLPALFAAQVARTPERIAVECDGRALSYAELDHRATAIACVLRARGIGAGTRVGICLPRSEHMLAAVLGVMKSGAAYVPLDPSFPEERLRYMMEHAQLGHVMVQTMDAVPPAVAAARDVFALADRDWDAAASTVLPMVAGNDLAYVLYTSGSTGQPKGVCVAHHSLANFLLSMQVQPGITADDVLCAITTLSFDIAGLELYLPLVSGARVLLASNAQRRDPDALLRLLREGGASILQTTPSFARVLVEHDRGGILGKLKLLVGGEELPRDLASVLVDRGSELWNMYGPTETTVWSSLMRVESGSGSVSLGREIANTHIHVLDVNQRFVPDGEIGEIWIGGDGVAAGYLFRDDLTAQRFRPDPFAADGSRMYNTGDLGSRHDGLLYFHGRTDQQLKLRGFRIEPGEIEAVALAEPDVREAVAVVREFGVNDQRLLLYVATRRGAQTLASRLRDRLREQLPPYMLPQHIELLVSLPKTPNGKIDRKALPPPAAVSAEQTVSTAPDVANPREAAMAEIWRDLIGVHDIRSEDNFFDVGGHSLLAVELVRRVQREYGVRLEMFGVATGTLSSLAMELPVSGAAGGLSLRRRILHLLGLH